ncbi:MAG: hypothetical protein RMJ33_11685 [Saprospiraceae bacterium]|nr:hypothetical protein [Saprospiraceae bacterium]MDW8230491.1 hypothetical protein [Saprospiraceae bacterium]
MKYILSLFVSLALVASPALAQTPGKIFSKSFNADGVSKIKFELPGAVDLKIWNHPTIRIEIVVVMPAGNESMLDQLAKVGRYDLKSDLNADVLTISAPNLHRVVKVKGEELRETVTYVVFMPKDIEVEIASALAAPGVVGLQKKP